MEQVSREGAAAERLAWRTSSSAAAWREGEVSLGMHHFWEIWERGEVGGYLCLRIVLALLSSADDGPAFVRIDEVGLVITHHTGGTGVNEGSNARLLTRLDDGGGAVDVDLLEQRMGDAIVGLGGRRRGVDDDLGLDLVEDGFELGSVGDVGLEVLDAIRLGSPVPRAA